jgi:hypothetical protein
MKPALLIPVLAGLSFLTACNGLTPIDDPGFDKWCGSRLCEWDTDEGEIKRVSTWNKYDYGVELVDTPTVISQLIDVSPGECLAFKILANVEAEAEVSFAFDVFDDGVIDHSEKVPGIRWGKQGLIVKLPETGPFVNVRLSLRKDGPGHAVIAELSAERMGTCEHEPFEAKQPADSECAKDADCPGTVCMVDQQGRGECVGCRDDSQCLAGKVCGSANESFLGLPAGPPRCVEPGSHEVGDQCLAQAECVAESICAVTLQTMDGVISRNCGECAADADCGDGMVCGVADVSDAITRFRTCIAPASRDTNHACFTDAECKSGRCCVGLLCSAEDGSCPR